MFETGNMNTGVLVGRTDIWLWAFSTYVGQVLMVLCDITKGQISIGCVFQHTFSEVWRWAEEAKDGNALTEVDFA